MILNKTRVDSHDSHIAKDTVTDMVREYVKKAVNNPNGPLCTVLMDITNAVLSNPNTENYVGNLPSAKTLAKNIQRKRKLSLDAPPLPKKWADMIVPENYKLTVNSYQFLFMDEEIPGGKKIWGFRSTEQIRICSSSSDLYGDGTFELLKSCMFMQLWIIVTRSASLGISFPALFFLLPNKSYPTYKSCMEKMRELGIQSPDKFHLDFEAAAIKAAKEVWPDTRIVTCHTLEESTL